MKGKILVTDGRSLAALAIIRSFGEKGFEVHCGDDFKNNLSSFSRYTKKRVLYPSPETQESDFIHFIINLIKNEQYDMIIPVRDDTTLLLSKYKEEISKFTQLYLANYKLLQEFRDKGQTIKLALENNIPVPNTFFPENMSLEEIKKKVTYPVLIRARISSGSRGIIKVESCSEFDDAYQRIKNEFGEPIIQEYINKTSYSTACLLLDGLQKEIASFTYARIKEYPISGGPTVVGVSTNDTIVKDYSLKLLQSIGWKGVAEIEYIIDSEGSPLLLEVNPRFWMPLNLAIAAGVDYPYLIYKLACGDSVEYTEPYKKGLKYRWVFPNEILWLTQTPDKIKGIKEFVNFWDKNTCYGDISIKDPFPLIGIMAQSLDFLLNKEKRKVIFKRGW
ncbi:putative ATP-grasp enzyme [Methanolobus tindarius DSM 2278]|uniref:Putative ATP-grasp enzyme n=1 Tax=Methanolobus tindarius DSM 2278 TaxID=1090322 RepID=W9DML2_METTI|nr:ATP-grasp domain-containing protein [Methanolobus tindarius]ETA66809.1 putative ATP-grasp enzyme [Methanolobus tindarius DSM 2278]